MTSDEPDRRPTPDTDPSRTATARRTPSASEVARLCLTLGGLLVPPLILMSIGLNFSIGAPASQTPRQIVEYELLAGACLALLLTGIVAAYLGDRLGRVFVGVPLLLVALAVVVVLPVPSDRWEHEAPVVEPTPRGPVCMGEGRGCVGG